MSGQATAVKLEEMTGPRGPVIWPEDCPGYGQDLPRTWKCPAGCMLIKECYQAYEARKDGKK